MLSSGRPLRGAIAGATLYCTTHPCSLCKMLINARIEVVITDSYPDKMSDLLAEAALPSAIWTIKAEIARPDPGLRNI